MVKNMNLKWKISLFITIIVVIVMGCVSYVTYIYTHDIVKDQVNKRIGIINNNYKNTLKGIINNTGEQISFLAKNEDNYYYTDMFSEMKMDEKNVDKFFEIYKYTIHRENLLLKNQLKYSDLFLFSYLTNKDGYVIADSRIKEKELENSIIAKKLDSIKYKAAGIDSVFKNNEINYVLFQEPVLKKDSEEIIGYYNIAVALDIFSNNLNQLQIENSNVNLVNKTGVIYNHNNKKLIGSKIDDEWLMQKIRGNENIKAEKGDKYRIVEQLDKNMDLYLAIDIPLQEINNPVLDLRNIIFFIALISIALIFVSGYFLLNWQLKPLNQLLTSFNRLQEGELKEEVLLSGKNIKRKDEIGILSRAFNDMSRQLKDIIANINKVSSQVATSSGNLQEVSEEVGDISAQVTNAIQEVATGAEDQSESVENINKKMKNLAGGIEKLDESNKDMEALADNMKNATSTGQQEINKVSKQMENIKHSIDDVASGIGNLNSISEEIDDILEIINNIAKQTNLLALNAAIEAARAGQAGQGFSVVADEIRELAEESVDSADKIGNLVQEIKQETKNASKKMKDGVKQVNSGEKVVNSAEVAFRNIQSKINEVIMGINQAIDVVKEINEDSEEMVNNLDNIAQISEETSANTEEVAASSQEQSASVEELTSLAENLSEMATQLNQLIKKFELD